MLRVDPQGPLTPTLSRRERGTACVAAIPICGIPVRTRTD